MDGLECSEILLSHAKREESRFDSEYYSKENLLLQTIIDTAGNKTINEYGGVLDCSAFYPSITGYYSNDNIVCEGGTPFGEDENEEGIVSLSPVNTEEDLDMLLAHVLGDDGGGADD